MSAKPIETKASQNVIDIIPEPSNFRADNVSEKLSTIQKAPVIGNNGDFKANNGIKDDDFKSLYSLTDDDVETNSSADDDVETDSILKFINSFSNQFKGTMLSILGILMLSPDSLLIRRLQNVPDFTVIFWLFLIKAICFFSFIVCVHKRKTIRIFKELGVFGWSAGILWGLSLVLFKVALQNTAVANVLVINASSTVFTSIFSYFMLGEVVPYRMIMTSLICFGAIILIFSGDFGLHGIADIVGTCLALASAITQGLFFTIIRYISIQNPEDTVGGIMTVYAYNVVAGLVGAIISVGFGPNLLLVSGIDAIYLLVDGIIVCTGGFLMLQFAPFFIPANEASLYFLIETIVGPLWVFLAGYEAPPQFTLYGGICLIFALALNSILAMREKPPEISESKRHDSFISNRSSSSSWNLSFNR